MQHDFKVIHHYEGGYSDGPSIEQRLNELGQTHKILHVNCVSREFIKDGSNHGHGGKYKAHYFIVACKEDI